MQPLIDIIPNVIDKQKNGAEMKKKPTKQTLIKNVWSHALNDAKHD